MISRGSRGPGSRSRRPSATGSGPCARAMSSQAATEGRYLGGRPPCGYQLADAGPHPNPVEGSARSTHAPARADPGAAPVVERIFEEYVGGAGTARSPRDSTATASPHPGATTLPATDTGPHQRGVGQGSAVRAILQNPRYTGPRGLEPPAARRGAARRGRRGRGLSVPDAVERPQRVGLVAPSRRTRPSSRPSCSPPPLSSGAPGSCAKRSSRRGAQADVLPRSRSSFCGGVRPADERARGLTTRDYRCGFPSEYAGATRKHERGVYLREAEITSALDAWLREASTPTTSTRRSPQRRRAGPRRWRPPLGLRSPSGSWPTATSAWPSTGPRSEEERPTPAWSQVEA